MVPASSSSGCELELRGPFDLATTLECGQAFRWIRMAGKSPGSVFFGGVIGGAGVAVSLSGENSSTLKVTWEPGKPPATSDVEGMVSRYFSLDDDLTAVRRELSRDEMMRVVLEKVCGLRILQQDPWECLASYILSSCRSIPAIRRTIESLAALLGEEAGLGFRRFPGPVAVLEAGDPALRASGAGFRAPYVVESARRVAWGEVDLGSLGEMATGRARSKLMKLPGVGPKVADCVLLFSYHKFDVFPVDVWVLRAMSRFYFGGKAISPSEARSEGLRRFGELAGYAQECLYVYVKEESGKRGWQR